MKSSKPIFKTVDEYIDSFPPEVQTKLETLRKTVKKAAPKAEEIISYGMAGYKQNGPVIYFAAFKAHIGVYPGSLKIRFDEPVPTKIISEMVKSRVAKNLKK